MNAKYGLNLLLIPRICPLKENKDFQLGSGSVESDCFVLAAGLALVLAWLWFSH